MAIIQSAFSLDANGVPITTLGVITSKTMTFAGGTTNDPGDFNGTGNPATLFTVTGDVIVDVVAVVKADLISSGGSIKVGVTNNEGVVLNTTTVADLDEAEAWDDNTPSKGEVHPAQYNIIGNGLDIIQTVETADITAGSLTYYCMWTPLSSDGNVVAA